jgi:hypothetical protein
MLALRDPYLPSQLIGNEVMTHKIPLARKMIKEIILCLCGVSAWCSAALAVDLTLGWDPNSEADLDGYAVYLKEGAAPGGKNIYGHVAIEDLEDPNNPYLAIEGLENGKQYFISLKAYSISGVYSAFSEPICVQFANDNVGLCSSAEADEGSGSTGGGSGSGGGCFIKCTANQQFELEYEVIFLALIVITISGFSVRFRKEY